MKKIDKSKRQHWYISEGNLPYLQRLFENNRKGTG